MSQQSQQGCSLEADDDDEDEDEDDEEEGDEEEESEEDDGNANSLSQQEADRAKKDYISEPISAENEGDGDKNKDATSHSAEADDLMETQGDDGAVVASSNTRGTLIAATNDTSSSSSSSASASVSSYSHSSASYPASARAAESAADYASSLSLSPTFTKPTSAMLLPATPELVPSRAPLFPHAALDLVPPSVLLSQVL